MGLKNISIAGKLWINTAAVCLLLLLMMIMNWIFMGKIQSLAALGREESVKLTLMARAAEIHVIQTQQWLTDISATRALKGHDTGFREAEKHAGAFRGVVGDISRLFERIDDRERIEFMKRFAGDFETYYSIGKEMARVYIDKGPEAGNLMMAKFDREAEKLQKNIGVLVKEQIEALNNELNTMSDFAASSNRRNMGIIFTVILISVILNFLIIREISSCLKKLVATSGKISTKDLTGRLEMDQEDEMGKMAASFNNMSDSLSTTINSITRGVGKLAVSASQMTDISIRIGNGSDETVSNSTAVSTEALQMSENMEKVAEAIEETSMNIETLVGAAEEMSVTVAELAREADEVRAGTRDAAVRSKATSGKVDELGTAADEIGRMTDVISEISERTNLLALNATIEAARAGDAGRGFAVVAGEIKELAGQTAGATADIGEKLGSIQESVKITVEDMAEISGVIGTIDRSMGYIAEGMGQQKDVTGEISGNIGQVSMAVKEISENAGQSTQAAAVVAGEMKTVTGNAEKMQAASVEVENHSALLNDLATLLQEEMGGFNIGDQGFDAGPIKAAHSLWKKKLSDLLRGKSSLRPEEIADHRSCKFGQWYFSSGTEMFGHLETFKRIDPLHEKVHATAREISRLFNSGDREGAARLFEEFYEITDNMFELLDDLEKETN